MASRGKQRLYTKDGTYTGAGSINVSGPGVWVTFVRGKERSAADSVQAEFEELVDELWPGAQEAHRVAKAALAAEREREAAAADAGGCEEGAAPASGAETVGEGKGDFDDELRKELEELRLEREVKAGRGGGGRGGEGEKGKTRRPPSLIIRRNTDVDCLLFFCLLPPIDPLQLVLHLLNRAAQTGISHINHVQRLLPTMASCPAELDEVERCMRERVLPGVFDQGKPIRYKVLYQAAQSNGLDRTALIRTVAESVPPGSGHTVDLSPTGAEYLLSARTFRSTASLGLIPNGPYEALKRFNVPACVEMGLKKVAEDGTGGRGGRVVHVPATAAAA